ncbi:peptidoglycan glycosyltransferase [Spongiactinospora gelatinilytica]|uniref:Peptidoglycan glycosyltransferase n=1 Tax=Spongiactinospora gelatinilytica TaxID=2666298 RepID=A0A2W2G7B6_9ACTN|nr:penicillin-binding transpeptidase domain-containing protein [Spongiactinospora gelatinilytica]PZG44211.1 peptidoglycan glycosyltransferase [Spongiactinospora gelatinilytica]
MNGPLKRASIACLLMFGLLMVNINYLQAVRADQLREDPRNNRNFYARYEVERGRITAGNEVLAESVEKPDSDFRFQRKYPHGPLYAHITGFFSPESESAIERSRDSLLDGSDPSLLVRRSIDLFTNKATKGANVDLTIVPKAQEAGYEALRRSGKRGAVVAIAPKTGAILTMVSVPTYDPNELSGTNKGDVFGRYAELDKNKNKPLINRVIDRTYPPGSTFKALTMAAYLEEDSSRGPSTMVEAPQLLDLPNTSADLPNYGGSACGAGRVTLQFALERSCNTPFGAMGMELGYDKMLEHAKKFGIGGEPLEIPMGVAGSGIGPKEDAAALAQASIGQRSNQMTPLQMAMIAAGIANDGKVMKPYLINKIADAEGGEVETAKPEELTTAISPETADKLQQMMVSVVNNGTATAARIPGVEVGGKTGTAETAEGQAPHAWFISFADVQDPEVAVAVLVESGSAGTDASGGHTAAPIAKAVMEAVLDR